MPAHQSSVKAAVSVSEMAELCFLSRSRFYSLVQSGAMPKPVQPESSKRPLYDQDLQQKCLEVRRTCIGLHGHPILFNRKHKTERVAKAEAKAEHADLIDALAELGLKANSEAITGAIKRLFPTGVDGVDQGQVVTKLFRDLNQKGRK